MNKNIRHLTPAEAAELLNEAPCGLEITADEVAADLAAMRKDGVGVGKTVDLAKYCAWIFKGLQIADS